ncbi:MAG: hypothetical protein U9O18_02375 [Chloroflexota bacterium]|nr:hypothetical protein [Chloroflexota bacterium]
MAALVLLLGLSVPPTGVAAAAGDPTVYWGAKAGPIDIPAKWSTLAGLPLPKGRFFVTATATLVGTGGSFGQYLGVECRLVLGSQVDRVIAAPTWDRKDGSRVPILLTVAGRLKSPAKARLRCDGETKKGDVRIRDIRVTAIRAGRLTLVRGVFPPDPSTTFGSGRPRIISARYDSGLTISGDGSYNKAGSIALPAGRWWVIAKTVARSSQGDTADNVCRLVAEADHDDLRFSLSKQVWAGDREPLGLQVVHSFDTPGNVALQCKGPHNFVVKEIVITAIKAGWLMNRRLEGGDWVKYGTGSPRISSGWSNGPVSIPVGPAFTTIRQLNLPKGRWTVLAKLWFEAESTPGDDTARRVICRLKFGSRASPSQVQYAASVSRVAPLFMSVNHHATSKEPVMLQCRRTAAGGTGDAYFVKITALKAGSLVKRHL